MVIQFKGKYKTEQEAFNLSEEGINMVNDSMQELKKRVIELEREVKSILAGIKETFSIEQKRQFNESYYNFHKIQLNKFRRNK